MATDPDRRSAARLAFLIALPLALAAGVISFWVLGGFAADRATSPPATSATPTAPGATGSAATIPNEAVAVPIAPLGAGPAAVCRAVVANLPSGVREAARRRVNSGAEHQGAAYGEPPITLACGALPASAPADGTLWVISGVCWHVLRASADLTVWTTVDRQVPVRVSIPAAYAAPAQWVVAFSAPVAAADPLLATPPPGCRPQR